VGYTINALMFLPALTKWNNLAVLGTVWNIGYLFITMALAFFVFHEHVTAKQTCGILLGFAAIYLLSA
jgi:drug/metabolite transporter (DMT)-like permease